MKAKVGVNLSGKIKLTLTDIRDGSKQVIEKNNMLLNHFWDKWFTQSMALSNANTVNTCLLGTGDTPPQPTDVGLSGTTLASNSNSVLMENPQNATPSYVPEVVGISGYGGTISLRQQTLDYRSGYLAFLTDATLVLCKQTGKGSFLFVDSVDTGFAASGLNGIYSVTISPDLTKVAVATRNAARIYEIDNDSLFGPAAVTWSGATAGGVRFSPDGSCLYIARVSSGELVKFDFVGGSWVSGDPVDLGDWGGSGSVYGMDISPSGSVVALYVHRNIYFFDFINNNKFNLSYVWELNPDVYPLQDGSRIQSYNSRYFFKFSSDNILTFEYSGWSGSSSSWRSPYGAIRLENGLPAASFYSDKKYSSRGMAHPNYLLTQTSGSNITIRPTHNFSYTFSVAANPFLFMDDYGDIYIYTSSQLTRLTFPQPDTHQTLTKAWSFPAGVGTGTVKEVGLRTASGSPYSSSWIARQVLDFPIEKTEFQQLDVEWSLNLSLDKGEGDIVSSGNFAEGQIDGSPIGWKFTMMYNEFLGFIYTDGRYSWFSISGTPGMRTGRNNLPRGSEGLPIMFGNRTVTDIGDITQITSSAIRTVQPYVPGSFSRTIRVFLNTDQSNDDIGSLSLVDMGTVLFDPPLQKVDTHRLYIDIEFGLNLNQGGE